jgi:hypothetical protein
LISWTIKKTSLPLTASAIGTIPPLNFFFFKKNIGKRGQHQGAVSNGRCFLILLLLVVFKPLPLLMLLSDSPSVDAGQWQGEVQPLTFNLYFAAAEHTVRHHDVVVVGLRVG